MQSQENSDYQPMLGEEDSSVYMDSSVEEEEMERADVRRKLRWTLLALLLLLATVVSLFLWQYRIWPFTKLVKTGETPDEGGATVSPPTTQPPVTTSPPPLWPTPKVTKGPPPIFPWDLDEHYNISTSPDLDEGFPTEDPPQHNAPNLRKPRIPYPIPPAPTPVEDILRLQIFLDNQFFCPGKLDGRPGSFTTKVLNRYQDSMGLARTEVENHQLDVSSVGNVYATYTIRDSDLQYVGHLPSGPEEQSKQSYLPYSDLLEFMTERFHCSPELLIALNVNKMYNLKPGVVVKVPAVRPFRIEDLRKGRLPKAPEFGKRFVKIDTRARMLELTDRELNRTLAILPITSGGGRLATPPGEYRVVLSMQLPTFRYDSGMLNYGKRTDTFWFLPSGPNNPVGIMWIGLNKAGLGIHGTNDPQSIGRSASHGCIRTANWDAVRLARLITEDIMVTVEGDPRPGEGGGSTDTTPRTTQRAPTQPTQSGYVPPPTQPSQTTQYVPLPTKPRKTEPKPRYEATPEPSSPGWGKWWEDWFQPPSQQKPAQKPPPPRTNQNNQPGRTNNPRQPGLPPFLAGR